MMIRRWVGAGKAGMSKVEVEGSDSGEIDAESLDGASSVHTHRELDP